jgi:SAM-dependent methyltransferase
MNPQTVNYYARNAQEVAHRYESISSPMARYVAVAFPAGGRILDIGAGTGRDLAHLHAAGYDAFGVEPVVGFAEIAVRIHPELQGRLASGSLPDLGNPFGGGFDGILCCAVLMHVPETDLLDTAFALRSQLKPHGRLLISLPLTRTDVQADERDANGRLFKTYAPEYLQLLFERIGFQMIGRWDRDGAFARAGTRWYTLLFELRAGSVRAVDQIEGICCRDGELPIS